MHLALTVTLCFPLLSLFQVTGLVPIKINVTHNYKKTNSLLHYVSDVAIAQSFDGVNFDELDQA